MKRFLTAALFFVGLLLIWQVLYSLKLWSPVLVPAPLDVARFIWDYTFNPGSAEFPNDSRWELFRAAGFIVEVCFETDESYFVRGRKPATP